MIADRALGCAAEENARLRALEDTLESRLAANQKAGEANTSAAVTRATTTLSSWLSSADARNDAKIAQLPTQDQARAPQPALPTPLRRGAAFSALSTPPRPAHPAHATPIRQSPQNRYRLLLRWTPSCAASKPSSGPATRRRPPR